MAIEVIVRHAYHEPKYLTRCYQCKSILRFMESDLIDNDDTVINKAAADANGDGEVTVGDITTIATMIIEANKE